MLNFILWNATTGVEVAAVGVSHEAMLEPPPDGCVWHEIAGSIADRTLAMVDGGLIEVDRQPHPEIALAKAQCERWSEAKAYRTTRTSNGCTTSVGRVQTNDDSRLAIREAANEASANLLNVPGWSVNWTMADNSIATLNAAQMVAMAAAVRAYVNACQAASQTVRAKIYAATTSADVASIDITAGYPAA